MTSPRTTPNLDPLRSALAQAEALESALADIQSFPPDSCHLIDQAETCASTIAGNLRKTLQRAEADALHALRQPAATLTPSPH